MGPCFSISVLLLNASLNGYRILRLESSFHYNFEGKVLMCFSIELRSLMTVQFSVLFSGNLFLSLVSFCIFLGFLFISLCSFLELIFCYMLEFLDLFSTYQKFSLYTVNFFAFLFSISLGISMSFVTCNANEKPFIIAINLLWCFVFWMCI